MAFAGTLSYPYIMIDRQIQTLRDCTFGSNSMEAEKFGFSFSIPEGYCILPNRLFPLDGSVEIVPKGFYFVFNEYALGTVAQASVETLLFEPVVSDRDVEKIISTLESGGFASKGEAVSTTTSRGIKFTLLNKALGTDGLLYDWEFTTHPDGKYFVGIVGKHSEAMSAVRSHLLQSFDTIPSVRK